ncbi:tetratricopeptide repeat protein [Bradyrhizobium erythrophlei]|uniref:Tetratricopeptide repeat-containing protein n=1 Tax=Bradyrhizobium erythrophlei TaxID=1437360 RepID=A0A1M7UV49_9BRAD|nr:tetratricopeptide repeat protein [Bradyrhizobium erythrophlei]SHN86911.1 Tetratricopeptide repeat-containing protein [Bradyrhizobium erythrophlei]
MVRSSTLLAALTMLFVAPNVPIVAQQIKAEGGVAIGGNVSNSTINIGIPPEQLEALVRQAHDLSEANKKIVAELQGKLDVGERQVRAALEIVGEVNVPTELLSAKLVEIAERFKALRKAASDDLGDNPSIVALKSDARKAIDAGDLARADLLLANVETEQRRALDRFAANVARTSGERGDIAMTRLRYKEAAKHFADVAAVFPPSIIEQDGRLHYLNKEADALLRLSWGYDDQPLHFRLSYGDDDKPLRLAIERYRRIIDLTPRERLPLDWANAQNNLGTALRRLGSLEEAVAAHRAALTEMTRERVPLDWAATQNSLGSALRLLGDEENSTARLEEAVAAHRAALTEMTRERMPFDWAATQHLLGDALLSLGDQESGTARLQEAIVAYRAALTERPLVLLGAVDRALARGSLGIAFTRLRQHIAGERPRK